jgi:hypothetical protein
MDPGLRTPLIESFRRGEVARDIRMLAARGAIASSPLEQVALLVLLDADPDEEIAAAARATIDALPARSVAGFLARGDVTEEIRQFFAARGIVPDRSSGDASRADEQPLVESDEDAPPVVPENTPVTSLPIMDRMKLALKGTREQRAVLIRDPNKIVSAAVLSSPKLTESEIEAFARMGNVSEDVLRTIGMNRTWTRNYSVMSALARNPKTPPAISLGLVARLNARDMKVLSTDRNVPEAVRIAARKFLTKAKGH